VQRARTGRDAILDLIAQDARGHPRLDVIEDASAPGGYRIEGTLCFPIANDVDRNKRAADQGEPSCTASPTVELAMDVAAAQILRLRRAVEGTDTLGMDIEHDVVSLADYLEQRRTSTPHANGSDPASHLDSPEIVAQERTE
jgi:hypothetical protein